MDSRVLIIWQDVKLGPFGGTWNRSKSATRKHRMWATSSAPPVTEATTRPAPSRPSVRPSFLTTTTLSCPATFFASSFFPSPATKPEHIPSIDIFIITIISDMMPETTSHLLLYHVVLLLLLFSLVPPSDGYGGGGSSSLNRSSKCWAPAVLVFGDSTADSGNNNFLPTTFRSNFPPYGRDFPDHTPTGRFSNGKLTADFVASYFGLKDYVPPYLDLSLGLEELLTGVSFASAGSGFDLLTSQFSGIMPVPLQIGLLQTYQARLLLMAGLEKTKEIIRDSIYLVSAGTNDFVTNYFPLPVRKKDFNIQQYETFVVQKIRNFVQELVDFGAMKIVVAGLPPMGCLPVVITFNWFGRFQERGCIEYYNCLAREFNAKLQAELQSSFRYGAARILYADIYSPVMNVISSPAKFGFEETMSGCCGTGLLEASFLCNRKSLVCPDASKYVFWDSIHPTEKVYEVVFNSLRSSLDSIC